MQTCLFNSVVCPFKPAQSSIQPQWFQYVIIIYHDSDQLFTMIYHDLTRFTHNVTMIHQWFTHEPSHDLPWVLPTIYHDVPMNFHGLPWFCLWFTLIYYDLPWFTMNQTSDLPSFYLLNLQKILVISQPFLGARRRWTWRPPCRCARRCSQPPCARSPGAEPGGLPSGAIGKP